MQVTHGTVSAGGRHPSAASPSATSTACTAAIAPCSSALVAKARELKLACSVLTFEPHPREFFAPATAPARLTRLREKLELIAEAGVDRTHVLRFGARLAALSAGALRRGRAGARPGRALAAGGQGFPLRREAARAISRCSQSAARRQGFELEAMADVMEGGERVSSSGGARRARRGRPGGRGAAARARRTAMSGRVAHGEKLGRDARFSDREHRAAPAAAAGGDFRGRGGAGRDARGAARRGERRPAADGEGRRGAAAGSAPVRLARRPLRAPPAGEVPAQAARRGEVRRTGRAARRDRAGRRRRQRTTSETHG